MIALLGDLARLPIDQVDASGKLGVHGDALGEWLVPHDVVKVLLEVDGQTLLEKDEVVL